MTSDWLKRQQRSTEVHVQGSPPKDSLERAPRLLLPRAALAWMRCNKTVESTPEYKELYLVYVFFLFVASSGKQRVKGVGIETRHTQTSPHTFVGKGASLSKTTLLRAGAGRLATIERLAPLLWQESRRSKIGQRPPKADLSNGARPGTRAQKDGWTTC